VGALQDSPPAVQEQERKINVMAIKLRAPLIVAALALSVTLAGCGGAAAVPGNPVTLTPPTRVTLLGGSAVDIGQGLLFAVAAVRGQTVVVGQDANGLNVVVAGGQTHRFYSDLAEAFIYSANYDYAIGGYADGSFIWLYRSNGAVITDPDNIAAVAKNADLFLETLGSNDQSPPSANLVTVRAGKLIRVPLVLSGIDSGLTELTGVAVNKVGQAIVGANSSPAGRGNNGNTRRGRRAGWIGIGPSGAVSALNQAQTVRPTMRRAATTLSATGYYLVSTTRYPIPLAMPTGATSVTVTTLNDKGISVGVANVGADKVVTPCYWDATGTAHLMLAPENVTIIYIEDINNEGAVVGEGLSDQGGSFGAIWTSLNAPMTNVSSLLPQSFSYLVAGLSAIGDDFTMAAVGVSIQGADFYYFGLRPF